MTSPRDEAFLRDLVELKLHRIAEMYQEVLNEAARKGTSIFEVLGNGHKNGLSFGRADALRAVSAVL